MPAGLQVFTNSGVLQVDGEYANLCMREKIAGVCNIPWTVYQRDVYRSGPINHGGHPNAAIALRSSAPVIVMWMNSTQFEVLCTDLNATFTAYVFADPPATGSSFGLQAYDAAGKLVFDAVRKNMRVAGAVVLPANQSTGSTTLVSGRTYAVMVSGGFWARREPTGAPAGSSNYYINEWLRVGSRVDGATIHFFPVHLAYAFTSGPGSGAGASYTSQSPTHALILDVTHF